MNTTSHKPYAKYEDDEYRPILGYESAPGLTFEKVPMVPGDDGNLVSAREYGDYEIVVSEPDEDTRQILHG